MTDFLNTYAYCIPAEFDQKQWRYVLHKDSQFIRSADIV